MKEGGSQVPSMQGFSLFSLEMCLCGEADVKTGLNMQGFYESRCMLREIAE
jgi:hypothetical protein